MLSISHGTPLRASAGYVLPGSRQPYAAAVKKPKGAIFPVFCTFPAGKGLHPASPCSHDGSQEKIWKNASFSSLSAVPFIFPDQPPPAFSSPSLQPLFIMGEKTGVRAKEKACFRTVRDKFQGFRPVVLDLRQKYARLSLSH